LDCELSIFPCFGGFRVLLLAVWTLGHNHPILCFCLCWFKTFYGFLGY
jgi:hypothetical protein